MYLADVDPETLPANGTEHWTFWTKVSGARGKKKEKLRGVVGTRLKVCDCIRNSKAFERSASSSGSILSLMPLLEMACDLLLRYRDPSRDTQQYLMLRYVSEETVGSLLCVQSVTSRFVF